MWKRARVTLRSREELPLPFGIAIEVRHKDRNGPVVARAITGMEEKEEYERQFESALLAQSAQHTNGTRPQL